MNSMVLDLGFEEGKRIGKQHSGNFLAELLGEQISGKSGT